MGEWLSAWWKFCSVLLEVDPISLISSSGSAIPLSLHRVSETKYKITESNNKDHAEIHAFIVCFLNRLLMCISPCLFTVGVETHTHSTLQRSGCGHTSHFHEPTRAEGPGRMKRLTKGVSISLPSSPILPRQADIVPAHSCSRFTGGLKFKQCGDVHTAHLPHYEQLGVRRSST